MLADQVKQRRAFAGLALAAMGVLFLFAVLPRAASAQIELPPESAVNIQKVAVADGEPCPATFLATAQAGNGFDPYYANPNDWPVGQDVTWCIAVRNSDAEATASVTITDAGSTCDAVALELGPGEEGFCSFDQGLNNIPAFFNNTACSNGITTELDGTEIPLNERCDIAYYDTGANRCVGGPSSASAGYAADIAAGNPPDATASYTLCQIQPPSQVEVQQSHRIEKACAEASTCPEDDTTFTLVIECFDADGVLLDAEDANGDPLYPLTYAIVLGEQTGTFEVPVEGSCEVTETEIPAGYTPVENPLVLDIEFGSTQIATVPFVNAYEQPRGQLSIAKTIENLDGAVTCSIDRFTEQETCTINGVSVTFEFGVVCLDADDAEVFDGTVLVQSHEDAPLIVDVPAGSTCTVTESEADGWTILSDNVVTCGPIEADAACEVAFENYNGVPPNSWALVVAKSGEYPGGPVEQCDGDVCALVYEDTGIELPTTFEFTIECSDGSVQTVNLNLGDYEQVDIDLGVECSVAETPLEPWSTSTPTIDCGTVAAGSTCEAFFDNVFDAGRIDLTKISNSVAGQLQCSAFQYSLIYFTQVFDGWDRSIVQNPDGTITVVLATARPFNSPSRSSATTV